MKRRIATPFLAMLAATMFATAAVSDESATRERGFRGVAPSGDGFDKPLLKKANIGVTIPTFNHPAMVAMMAGIKQAAKDYNINVEILDGQNDPEKQLDAVEGFITKRFDAIMINAAAVLGSWFLLNRTIFGRYLYATGSNHEAARLSGVRTDLVIFLTYVISGSLAGLGGILLASRLSTAAPIFGEGYELDAIAAVVIGGTSLSGGRGKISGTVAGVLIIGIVNNALNLLGVSAFYQLIVKGLIVALAVILDKNWRRGVGTG